MGYSCHICGDIGHKIIDYPKYNEPSNKTSSTIFLLTCTWILLFSFLLL
jgi:hypothetical protein